ncbi:hypothetical protein G8E10_24970 [Rhizobiaceae bacterium CRRU44]|uniref:Uncharacterized protein n=1 Tax=Ferranicluibacter rubi TaxID=2715133 RepID=A0AA43ZL20_9HYPH|nr:hypothetical protein [Ferranicluibacter rubi]NHT78956.1 hypothetical protein [Ferranicluibacter rubi]
MDDHYNNRGSHEPDLAALAAEIANNRAVMTALASLEFDPERIEADTPIIVDEAGMTDFDFEDDRDGFPADEWKVSPFTDELEKARQMIGPLCRQMEGIEDRRVRIARDLAEVYAALQGVIASVETTADQVADFPDETMAKLDALENVRRAIWQFKRAVDSDALSDTIAQAWLADLSLTAAAPGFLRK